ncbi:MAG: tRNA epoxyqueuosine(34) reductase QueG [Gudongella sp.]|nr:tRNA epoxyqueuosine(34) reductase QueG [Gudongella sp.]
MLRETILEKAKKIGIEMIGFTRADPFYSIESILKERIAENNSPEFEEKNIEIRLDPKKTMENCKSIIVIGLSYYTDMERKDIPNIKGSLSRSSWGIDYHRVLTEHMKRLVDELEETIEFESMIFTDTGPLVDRELAYRAGIGYYGKNCSLINPKYGSFFFIGYILTNLDIAENDILLQNQCGDCELCLKACPTNALLGSGKLDTKRCISYLTQTKKPIKEELARKMGIKIYGCDTCQLVCPKNRGIEKSTHIEFKPYKTGGFVDIEELVEMSKRAFNSKYGDMSGSWRGKNVLIRNSLIALNNISLDEHYNLIKDVHLKQVELLKPYASMWLENYDRRQ